MKWANDEHPAELAMDCAATAVFAAAIAFALGVAQVDARLAVILAAIAALLVFAALRTPSVEPRQLQLAEFEPAPIELVEEAAVAELLLEDELGSAEPDSRVVQLFDPRPEPGAGGPPAVEQGDASQALSEALEELRRSLR